MRRIEIALVVLVALGVGFLILRNGDGAGIALVAAFLIYAFWLGGKHTKRRKR